MNTAINRDDSVEEIKNRLDIVDIVSDYVQLRPSGQNHKGLCPFHAEKTPSFMVNRAKQIFHCFGCGAGGDVFTFLMRQENLDFREALEMLAKRAGVELKPATPGKEGLRRTLRSVLAESLAFFRESLQKSPDALKYLLERGIEQGSVEGFSLGFAPEGWQTLHGRLRKKGFSDDHLIQAGVAAEGRRGPYDIFRARIIFPIFDLHGEPVAFGGRVMDDSMPKYLNSPDTPLFKKSDTLYAFERAREEISKKGYAVVVEGYLDAIMCHQNGITNVVAPLGTALTEGHLRKLGNLADNVLLVFDGDSAGIAAARRSMAMALENGLRVKALALGEGQDPDSLLRGKGAGHFRKVMAGADTPVGFVLRTSASRGKTGSVKEAIEIISKCGEPLLRDELITELSDLSGAREMTIREQLGRFRRTGRHSAAARATLAYNEEVLLLSAALAEPDRAQDILREIEPGDFEEPLIGGIFQKIHSVGEPSAGDLMALADTDEEAALLSRLSVEPGFDAENIGPVVSDCVDRIRKRKVDRAIESLDGELRKAEAAGDRDLQFQLLKEKQKLLQGA